MPVNKENFLSIKEELSRQDITLVAVSKTKPAADIMELYDLGQRDFGENYVQELLEKQAGLPSDIRWHFIGHLQSNKVKYLSPFVYLIHGVDSLSLLKEINKQAAKNGRIQDCLLQVHIAQEETKFGLNAEELDAVLSQPALPHVRLRGLMGMASFSDDASQVSREFHQLKQLYDAAAARADSFSILSMGMSGDYQLAVKEGSTLVRIGSLLFGQRK